MHPSFKSALSVIEKLQDAGHAAVFAGGCVRDSLLGVVPKDLDIATSALPEFVEGLFEQTIPIGKAFGTVVVVLDGQNFETTTFRKDGPYLDGRHPQRVEFSEMQEDAKRRDFTVNAMFYDPVNANIFDYVDGRTDLDLKLIRTVGEAELRFNEDRLRLLRAIRFHSQLAFSIELKTWQAVCVQANEIRSVSKERVANEMCRLLEGKNVVSAIRLLMDSKMNETIWPELDRQAVENLERFLPLVNWLNVFAALMLEAGSAAAERRLREWKLSKADIQCVCDQIRGVGVLLDPRTRLAEKVLTLAGQASSEILLLARGKSPDQSKLIQGAVDAYLKVADSSGRLPRAFLSGGDLISLGVEPGNKMGLLLKAHYYDQLEDRIHSRAEALEWVKLQIKA